MVHCKHTIIQHNLDTTEDSQHNNLPNILTLKLIQQDQPKILKITT